MMIQWWVVIWLKNYIDWLKVYMSPVEEKHLLQICLLGAVLWFRNLADNGEQLWGAYWKCIAMTMFFLLLLSFNWHASLCPKGTWSPWWLVTLATQFWKWSELRQPNCVHPEPPKGSEDRWSWAAGCQVPQEFEHGIIDGSSEATDFDFVFKAGPKCSSNTQKQPSPSLINCHDAGR